MSSATFRCVVKTLAGNEQAPLSNFNHSPKKLNTPQLGAQRSEQLSSKHEKVIVPMSQNKRETRMQIKVIVFTGFIVFGTGLFVELVLLR